MTSRDHALLNLRPNINGISAIHISKNEEQFQNQTLRPILKFQNELFIEVFRNYTIKQKNTFYDLSLSLKIRYIENAIKKDIKLRNSLKGIVLGHFTLDEYKTYTKNASSINKRIMQMLIERLQSQIQLFETPVNKTL